MTATVSKGKVISLEYTLKLDDNQVVDTNVGKDPLTYTQGANQIIRGVETGSNDVTTGILPVQLRADLDVFRNLVLRHS